jgi:ABC-2 type transport system ATP-binding protein
MQSPYVVARGLGKSFSNKSVLRDVSFIVAPGDVVGVLGKNGAGKTTLLELVLGFTPATAGEVEIFGHASYKMPGATKARIGFVPQQDELITHLTAADQLRVIRSFYNNWDDELVANLAAKWGIDLNERVRAMSVGQRQKLSILLSLGHRPDLLILDEPVASLDPVARRHFLEQIVEVAADQTRAVIFSSHIVSDIERLANKIWIIKDNGLYWSGDFDDLKESVVRLHLRSTVHISPDLKLPSALSLEVHGNYATAIIFGWNEEIRQNVAAMIDDEIDVEPLALEDIFLELHK